MNVHLAEPPVSLDDPSMPPPPDEHHEFKPPETTITKQTMVSFALVIVLVGAVGAGVGAFATLTVRVDHLADTVSEMARDLRELKDQRRAEVTENSQSIALIIERMRQDDDREKSDTELLRDLDRRVMLLERGK